MIRRMARRGHWTICFDAVMDDSARANAYRIFQSNPAHPALQFKKLEGETDIYSVRVGLDYRALG